MSLSAEPWLPISPRHFISATGARAAVLGHEAGPLEIWTWPVKILHDLSVEIQPEASGPPIPILHCPGSAKAVPGQFMLEFAHDAANLRLRARCGPDDAWVIIALDLECERALRLLLRFRPAFTPMWPAAWGARILEQDKASGALLLSEELGRFGALVGWADEPVTGAADHGMPQHELVLERAFPQGASQTIHFVVAAARADPPAASGTALRIVDAARGHARLAQVRRQARELFDRVTRDPEASMRSSVERERLGDVARLECSDRQVQEAWDGAVQVIASSRVNVEGVGSGLVAGLAAAGAGDRPGFAWLFDGDALCAAEALSLAGAHEEARRVFEEAASRQRDDGKIMHELTLAAEYCDWEGDFPYAYYKGENTGAFLALLERHVARSGDTDLVRKLETSIERALSYLDGCSDGGLFLLERAGLGCVESGPLCGELKSEAYCQGLLVAATRAASRLFELLGRSDKSAAASATARAAHAAFHARFLDPASGRYRFGLDVSGGLIGDAAAYLGLPLSFGVGEDEAARRTAAGLNAPGSATDWGVRMFDRESPFYDPAHYNTGAVFPYLSGFVVRALYDHGQAEAGWQLLSSQLALTGFSGRGLVPEHLMGERATQPERGVPHQIFSSAMILQGLLAGMLGLRVDEDSRLVVAPALPPFLPDLRLRGLNHRGRRFDLLIDRPRVGAGETSLALTLEPHDGVGELHAVRWRERLPALSVVNDRREQKSSLTVTYRAGPELDLRADPPRPGARSQAPRLIETRTEENARIWTLAAPTPGPRTIPWTSQLPVRWEGPTQVSEGELTVEFAVAPAGAYPTAHLRAELVDP